LIFQHLFGETFGDSHNRTGAELRERSMQSATHSASRISIPASAFDAFDETISSAVQGLTSGWCFVPSEVA